MERTELDKLLQLCKWCNGSGDDGGGYGACPDCESTGYVGGKFAVEVFDEKVERDYQKYKEKTK